MDRYDDRGETHASLLLGADVSRGFVVGRILQCGHGAGTFENAVQLDLVHVCVSISLLLQYYARSRTGA